MTTPPQTRSPSRRPLALQRMTFVVGLVLLALAAAPWFLRGFAPAPTEPPSNGGATSTDQVEVTSVVSSLRWQVSNHSGRPSTATVTLALAEGLSLTRSGAGWRCTTAGPYLQCESAMSIGSGATSELGLFVRGGEPGPGSAWIVALTDGFAMVRVGGGSGGPPWLRLVVGISLVGLTVALLWARRRGDRGPPAPRPITQLVTSSPSPGGSARGRWGHDQTGTSTA